MASGNKERIDLLLVKKGFFPSREQAQRAIMAGLVFAGDERVEKAGTKVPDGAELEVRGKTCPYVSRGGLKLAGALDHFDVSIEGKTVLDAGASTGGFTQCLLERGVRRVYAVDVGYGQLAWSLRQDPRVVVMERTNLRYLTLEELTEPVDLVTLDLSFISLEKVLPAVYRLLKEVGAVVALVKPQFEAGRESVGKGGIVRDKAVHLAILHRLVAKSEELGFTVKGLTYSPIKGGEGNIEFFIWLSRSGPVRPVPPEALKRVVDEAHQRLASENGGGG